VIVSTYKETDMMTQQTHQMLFVIMLFVMLPASLGIAVLAYDNWRKNR
jgi:hypothetical protein